MEKGNIPRVDIILLYFPDKKNYSYILRHDHKRGIVHLRLSI